MRRADPRARSLRKSMPPTEAMLWSLIRRQQIGYKFRRQVKIDRYYADFACLSVRLVVELDGAQHNEPKALERDRDRDQIIENEGWSVIRFWNHEVMEAPDDVLWAIRTRCDEREQELKQS